jgi:DNA polymerase III alpha subunit
MLSGKERLLEICQQGLVARGLSGERIEKRLAEELAEISKVKDEDYFLDLHDRKVKYAKNENNSLVAYLLGIVNDISLEREVEYTSPEWP